MGFFSSLFGGKKKETYSNGWYYGEFSSSGKRHGYGEYHYDTGNWYEGQWSYGDKHGEGTYHYRNGEWLTGTFRNNDPDYGTYYWSYNEYCRGYFRNWKLHGECTYTKNGSTFKCLYDNGTYVRKL